MLTRWLSLACLALGAGVLGLACTESDSTQIVVLMDTDYPVPDEVGAIRARVSRGDTGANPWTRVFSLDPAGDEDGSAISLPASFGIIPGAAGLDPQVNIEVAALSRESNRVLVERAAQTNFIEGQARMIRLLLYQVCEAQVCASGESCGCDAGDACNNPSCVSVRIDPGELEPVDNPGALPPEIEFPMTAPPLSCETPLAPCAGECVDLSNDPKACGSCNNACPQGWDCSQASCVDPTDCRDPANTCSGFSYCNQESGSCERGCARDAQCTQENERCEVESHECVCRAGFDRCRFSCVDTSNDPRFCGTCETICESGEVCDEGDCIDPGDCRNPGAECAGFTFCDLATGDCEFGCDRDAQCDAEVERCDLSVNDCVCAEGFHLCGSTCSPDDSVDTCGESCVPCPAPANGSATCEDAVCGFVCADGYEPCDDACCEVIDPCSCEGAGIECGMTELCDASIDCGACDPDVNFCIDGTCRCADPFEPNGLAALASQLQCDGGCNLRNFDESVVGSLSAAGDFDFFEFDVRHDPNRALELEVTGLESQSDLFLTYVCDDGGQQITGCSGETFVVLGLDYCVESNGSVVQITQACADSPGARGTVVVGLRPTNFVGPCDVYALSVRSFDPPDD